jgi:hypothetical protein
MGKTGQYSCRSRPELHFGITWNGLSGTDFTSLVVVVLWPTVFADAIPLFRLENLLDLRPIEKQIRPSGPSCFGQLTSFLLSNRPEYIHNGVAFHTIK